MAKNPSRFARAGVAVLARPSLEFGRREPLHLVYEVYGLDRDADGRRRFQVDYTVRAERLERGALERLFRGLQGLVGVRGDAKFDHLESVHAAGRIGFEPDLELAAGHRQCLHRRGDLRRQLLRGRFPRCRQFPRGDLVVVDRTRAMRASCGWRCRTKWIAMYGVDYSTAEQRTRFLDRVTREMRRVR